MLPSGTVLTSVPSTNRYVLNRWDTAAPYYWVAAREQTAGRGRLGRRWEAPESSALLISILVPVPSRSSEPGLVTLAAALAVQKLVLDELPSADVQLKWPNDVQLGGKKVAGILAEYAGREADDHMVVVGVGLNLTTPKSVLDRFDATSLAANGWAEAETSVSDSQLTGLGEALVGLLRRTLEDGNIVSQFQEHCTTLGERVTVTLPGGQTIQGNANGITNAGELLVGDVPLRAGEVTLAKTTNTEELT